MSLYYCEKTGGVFNEGSLEELRERGIEITPLREISEEEYRAIFEKRDKK